MKLYEFTEWPELTLAATEAQIDDEPMIQNAFLQVGFDWTVLDAGASIGYYSVLAGLKATEGIVVAIEPHPLIADALRKNLALHNVVNVHICGKALTAGTDEGTVVIRETDGRGGTQIPYKKPPMPGRLLAALRDGSLIRKVLSRLRRSIEATERYREFTVETCTIDQLVQEFDLKRLDLVKMDIQGAEYNALQGATNTLRKHRPILLVELHRRPQWSYQEIIDFLKAQNYRVAQDSSGHADFLRAEPVDPWTGH